MAETLPTGSGPPFYGRSQDVAWLRAQARAVARGRGESVVIAARPGAGKSTLLRRFAGILFAEAEVLPFIHGFPRRVPGAGSLAERLALDFAAQVLAFRRREPTLPARQMAPETLTEGLRAAWGAGGGLIAETLRALPSLGAGSAETASATLPGRFAALTGTRVLCLYDDVENLAGAGSAASGSWPAEVLLSAEAPSVLAVGEPSRLVELLGRDAASRLPVRRLGPMSDEALGQLLRSLMRVAGCDIGGRESATLVRLAAGSPFYLVALARAVAEAPGRAHADVFQAYARTVCTGDLSRHWVSAIEEAIPARTVRSAAVEILAYALREEPDGPDVGRLPALMFKEEALLEAALEGLRRAGVARLDCSRLFLDEDPVFRDAVTALYRREFGRADPDAIEAAMAAEKARAAPGEQRRRHRRAVREALREILRVWDGQSVPAVLFDAHECERRFGADPGGLRVADLPPGEARVTLPKVVAVAAGRVGQGSSLAGLEVDALAWGQRPEDGAEVAWVVRHLAGGADAADGLGEFAREVAAMQAAGDLPEGRLVRWAILAEPPDAAGGSEASRARIKTSTRGQLEALAGICGVFARLPPEPAPERAVEREVEFEMSLPKAADAELVAARALEQLAENVDLDPDDTGRVRTALVEACINAFEHSGARGGRVRLSFTVSGRELAIRVENSGRSLASLPAVPAGGETLRKRGWGLTLIRELMDEVSLEPREDGVSLLMVKRLPARKEEGVG